MVIKSPEVEYNQTAGKVSDPRKKAEIRFGKY